MKKQGGNSMKKLSFLLFLIIVVSSLTGCVQDAVNKVDEGKAKIEYFAKIGGIVLSTTNATLALNSLYQDPLSYGTEQWKEEFYENKQIIEDNHKEVTALTVPTVAQEAHDGFVSALELTMEVNEGVDVAIQSGEKLTDGLTKQLDEAISVYNSFSSLITELKQ
jgi:hypothetical protein